MSSPIDLESIDGCDSLTPELRAAMDRHVREYGDYLDYKTDEYYSLDC